MHRIPYSPKSPAASNKPAVFLQHGIGSSSYSWIALGPNISLGYLLADAGYDVWLGNSRGNIYSLNHTTLTPDNGDFWNFSFEEMGIFDLPAEFEYIFGITKQDSLFYEGFSMGTSMFFVLTSENPEYNHKIKFMIAEAPVVLIRVDTGNILTASLTVILGDVLNALGIKAVDTAIWPRQFFVDLCVNELTHSLCDVVKSVFGLNLTTVGTEVAGARFPHPASVFPVKTIVHYIQIVNSGKFQHFDYGEKENLQKYNQVTPPDYNLSAVVVPVALYYGPSDQIVNPKDVLWLNETLPNCIEVYRVPRDSFGHENFVDGQDIKSLVNDRSIDVFNNFN
ncbi:hypothetical protein L9F63_013353 [Diploptera punctata]|uniref:AB hydrolase-1 domain-containing protein n=1 Tax=Diploptera punctata TaxID=6984 RepID=A0AAD8ABU8_DIPPU|nr:hypothetical protein L9F63_013353 [Diploptera punctata]